MTLAAVKVGGAFPVQILETTYNDNVVKHCSTVVYLVASEGLLKFVCSSGHGNVMPEASSCRPQGNAIKWGSTCELGW